MTEDSKSLDILGVRPLARAVEQVSASTIQGISAFLGKICMPAAEEYGLLLQDKVRARRARNTAAILLKAEALLEQKRKGEVVQVHPRILTATLEGGAWAEDDEIQRMWAGLLVSGCTKDGDDDSNIIFIDILSRLTGAQCRVMNFSCERTRKTANANGLVLAYMRFFPDVTKLMEASGITDIHRLDMELDHLREIGLISGGFDAGSSVLDMTATPLAINLYVRCQGFVGPAISYFDIDPATAPRPTNSAHSE